MLYKNLLPVIFLRTIVSLLMIMHGIARIAYGIVDDFGVFLDDIGFPAGFLIAWFITLIEITGGICIIAGYYIRYLSVYFIFQLIMGIILVHWQEGWFVVGAGRNGMEYSILLISVLIFLGWKDFVDKRNV